MGTTRNVSFLIGANARDLYRTLDKAQRKFKRWGRKTERIGRNISQNFTMPMALAGGASLKMASDFESSMLKINTLIGVPLEKVNEMKDSVIELSNQTGRSSKELADALFVVNSAGIKGAESLSILEQSAKAAAIGLGETKQIARATTAVMQAYGKENISAAEATDTLLQTVKAGNLEASQLAPVLGRVIGIASQLGISFKEVGANIATFTRLGVSSEEAVTGLRSVMNSLLKPTAQARKALASIGWTFEDLRESVSGNGLAATLRTLMKRFDGNSDRIAQLFPNVRALSNVMATAGSQGEEYSKILKGMGGDVNQLDESFQKVSKTTKHRFNKALQKLSNLGIKIGTKLFPIVNKLLSKVEQWVDWFSNLSDSTQNLILKISGIVAVTGPALIAIGKMAQGISALIGFFGSLSGAVAKAMVYLPKLKSAVLSLYQTLSANPLYAIATAITAIGTAAYFAHKKMSNLKNSIKDTISTNIKYLTIDSLNKQIDKAKEQIRQIQNLKEEYGSLDKNTKKRLEYWQDAYDKLYKKRQKLAMQEFRTELENEPSSSTNANLDTDTGGGSGSGYQISGIDIPMVGKVESVKLSKDIKPDLKPLKFDFKVGSIGYVQKRIQEVENQITRTVSDAERERLRIRRDSLRERLEGMRSTKEKAMQLGQAIQSTVNSAFASFGETLGNVFTGDAGAGNFFSNLLTIVMDFANKLGKIMIAIGTAGIALKKAFANPFAAIAAGTALIALSTAAKNMISKGPQGSTDSAEPTSKGRVGMATGGIIPDGFPNDSYPANLTSGEAVIPPKQLGNLGASESGMQRAFERALANSDLRLQGSDIVMASNNTNSVTR